MELGLDAGSGKPTEFRRKVSAGSVGFPAETPDFREKSVMAARYRGVGNAPGAASASVTTKPPTINNPFSRAGLGSTGKPRLHFANSEKSGLAPLPQICGAVKPTPTRPVRAGVETSPLTGNPTRFVSFPAIAPKQTSSSPVGGPVKRPLPPSPLPPRETSSDSDAPADAPPPPSPKQPATQRQKLSSSKVRAPAKLSAQCWVQNGGIMKPVYDAKNFVVAGDCSLCDERLSYNSQRGPHVFDSHIRIHVSRGDVAPVPNPVKPSADQVKRFDTALAVAVILNHWPLSVGETDGMKLLASELAPLWSPATHHTLKENFVEQMYNKIFVDNVEVLRKNDCVFSIQYDGWKAGKAPGSNRHRGFIGITFSTIDRNWQRHVATLAVRRLKGHHGADSMFELLEKVITVQHGIPWSHIASLHTDNHLTECNVADLITAKTGENAIHIRDFPHTMHLSVGDLFDNVPEAKAMLELAHDITGLFVERRLFSEKLVEFALEADKSAPTTLVQDVKNRWNSAFHMFQRLERLEKAVTRALQYELDELGSSMAKDTAKLRARLTDAQSRFDGLKVNIPFMLEILRPCYDASNAMEGDNAYAAQLIRVVDNLEARLHVRTRYPATGSVTTY